MSRIKVRFKGSPLPPSWDERSKVTKILAKHKVDFQKLHDLRDGWVVQTLTNKDVEKLLSKEVKKDLDDAEMGTQPPNEIKAKYTLVLSNS